MDAEMAAIISNYTWDLVPKPSDVNIVGNRWLFRHKFDSNGRLERYKARLVAQGFSQQPGLDFDDTFSPVVKPATIRTVLSISISRNWPIHQLDVKNAFLHGDLTKTVYMRQPPGYVNSSFPDHVCRLRKALYGLKQAPRAWYHRFAVYLSSLGFLSNNTDTSLFTYHRGSDTIYLLLYVDDIILTASSPTLISMVISKLSSEFPMSDLGSLSFFLGVAASRSKSGLFLSQSAFAQEILARADRSRAIPAALRLTPKQSLLLMVSLFLIPPYIEALLGTLSHGLHLKASAVDRLVAYSDADWAGCPNTRRSTSGFCVYLGDNLVSWSSKRQHVVSRSSAEAEYQGIANVVAETAWLRNLLLELFCPLSRATVVFCDNVSAMYLASNPVQHQRTKHVKIDLHFVRERVAIGHKRRSVVQQLNRINFVVQLKLSSFSTQACPYDGYLVTEAGSKPLMESNKALAETIGKTTVHCLYHRSGCMWQGPLSDCTTHCSGCAFGNSPVVCNRCGIQIVHRQVQEHAQTCNVNGTNTQPQQGSESAQDPAVSGAAVSVDQSKIANQVVAPASQPQASHAATAPAPAQNPNQPATANPVPQAMPATAVPTPEQWYQQQYQQYYQQYPGYDPYQQQAYQQYYPYQQQPAQQFQQPPLQPQPQSQPQPVQPQAQNYPQPQPQTHSQAQPHIPSNVQPQPLYPQAAVVGPNQSQGQLIPQQQAHPGGQPHVPIQSQNQPLPRGHMPPQPYSQAQPHPVQNHGQPHMQVPQYQQPHPQMHHSQPPQVHPHPQTQSQPQPQSHPQVHPHYQPHPQPQSQPINPQHPPVQPMAGHPSYPSQPHQQIQHPPPQQHPMQVQQPAGQMPVQFPQPPPHMRPPQPPHMLPSQGQTPGIPPTQQHIHPQNQPGLPAHQRPLVPQVQQPMPQQYVQQPQAFAGSFAQQHSQVRPQGPPQPMQQPPLGFVQPQQGAALPHGMPQAPPNPSQSYGGRPAMLNQGGQSQQFPQSSGAAGIAPHARPPQFVPSQASVNQSNVNMTNQPQVYSEQHGNQYMPPLGGAGVDRKGEPQEDKSPSLKKSEPVANDFGSNFNEVKHDTGMNDERKPGVGEDDHRKDEASNKDAGVHEMHQIQGVPGDSVTAQRVKEESKDGVVDHSPGGKLSHNKAEDVGVATIDSVKQGEASVNFQGSSEVDNGSLTVPPGSSQGPLNGQFGDGSGGFPSKGTEQSPHPPAPYAFSGQQQRPAAPSLLPSAPSTGQPLGQPPSHIRPPGHGYLPPGPHQSQPGSFHPEYPGSASSMGLGANNLSNSRGYEPNSAGSHGQYNQGQIPQSSHARPSRMSQGEPLGPPLGSAPLPHGPDGQTVPRHPGPMETDMYQNQRPPHFDNRRPDSHFSGNLDRGPYGQPFGVESNSMRMNGAPPQGHDSTSGPGFRDEKFRTPTGMHPDNFPMGPSRHPEQGEFKGALNQFPGPPHLGSEDSPKFASHSSRPLGGYAMDGPSRFLDKDPHGYGYDAGQRVDPGTGGPPSAFLPPYQSAGGLHPNESGGRPLPASMHDENRGRFDNNRQNPDFLAPMHGFGRHHMDRLPPGSPGNPSRSFGAPHNIDVDGREMERHPYGERFPMGPPGHMHRGEFDGPGKLRSEPFGLRNHLSGHPHVGEPGFGSFQDYGRSGESNGPGGFSHQQPFGESYGAKSTRPHLGEPGFRSSYSRQGFPSDGGFYAGGSDSFDQLRKRKPLSMGWCRICQVDCESVEGLDIHGQTREHQRMAMDMVISIKQKSAKKQKTSNEHSAREEASKLRNAEIHARVAALVFKMVFRNWEFLWKLGWFCFVILRPVIGCLQSQGCLMSFELVMMPLVGHLCKDGDKGRNELICLELCAALGQLY
ncbi:hypothetical protein OSB04_001336 [Centaurea solstitialis]|uniref:Reverse transcriptase Ty1/copia-type domain-containing protein n=1 Tax=Centaurea solstitialis TaxID=347529 RepID=A0AA38WSL8_9ASTR|nr:hypothetical protein OSB04_001336 [Centaurea solstitialis]